MAAAAVTKARDRLQGSITTVALETMRLLPNGLIAASGLYALFTASRPFAAFFLAMVEAGFIHRLLNWIASYLSMSTPNLAPSSFSDKCRSSFSSRADFTGVAGLYEGHLTGSFPSYPYFMLTVASTYMFMTLNKLSKELEALGPAFSSRYYSSMIFLGLLLLVFFAFRLQYGCDSFLTLVMTLIVGYLAGLLLVEQNHRLFGTDSINMIGIPLLKNRAANGQPIYVCPRI